MSSEQPTHRITQRLPLPQRFNHFLRFPAEPGRLGGVTGRWSAELVTGAGLDEVTRPGVWTTGGPRQQQLHSSGRRRPGAYLDRPESPPQLPHQRRSLTGLLDLT